MVGLVYKEIIIIYFVNRIKEKTYGQKKGLIKFNSDSW